MNFKKILLSALAGASMLAAFVGPAAATGNQIDINIYGASAQYLYWNAAAPGIINNYTGSGTCTTVGQADLNMAASGTASYVQGITKGTCSNGDVIYVRVGSKASYEGLYTLLGNATYAKVSGDISDEACNDGDATVDYSTVPAGQAAFFRKMAFQDNCTFTANPTNTSTHGLCTVTRCARITMGVSDVAGKSFTQSSHGQLKGPNGGGSTDRTFSSITVPSNIKGYNPIVVPFAFFVNNSVKRMPDGVNYTDGTGASVLSNLPRMMAVQIFSGNVKNWSDFGPEFVTGLPVMACLRHAGSGTAATLAYAVMNNKWGSLPASNEKAGVSGKYIYFNDGSGDEVNCINSIDNVGHTTGTPLVGAIGYADADQSTSGKNITRVKFNGEDANRANIINGRYDFWTNEWAYIDESVNAPGSTVHNFVDAMMTYASDPTKIPSDPFGFWGGNKSAYWAAGSEITFDKASDQLYPTLYTK